MSESTLNAEFPVGIIEGFFGTPWSMESRTAFIRRLPPMGLNFYIYAPKNDSCLRSCWHREFSGDYLESLIKLANVTKSSGLKFGIGFSPLGATADPDVFLPLFRKQVSVLVSELSPYYFALLFDDMKISLEHEGAVQNRFIRECLEILKPLGIRLITCSSFYTTDPILEKVFGKMPECYYGDLLRDIPSDVDFFWTGPKVISTEYGADDLKTACGLLGRKPFIWDNYPVNDGRKASDYLYLGPFANRNEILSHAAGIAVNPMKQTFLNLFPLASLGRALRTNDAESIRNSCRETLAACHGGRFIDFIGSLTDLFAGTPLPEISEDEKLRISRDLDGMRQDAERLLRSGECGRTDAGEKTMILNELEEIREIQDFLHGRYEFDPACLTG